MTKGISILFYDALVLPPSTNSQKIHAIKFDYQPFEFMWQSKRIIKFTID